MTRKKYVIYRFILAAVVFVIVGAIFDYFVEGIFVPRNTIKMIFTGVLVELVLMAGLSAVTWSQSILICKFQQHSQCDGGRYINQCQTRHCQLKGDFCNP